MLTYDFHLKTIDESIQILESIIYDVRKDRGSKLVTLVTGDGRVKLHLEKYLNSCDLEISEYNFNTGSIITLIE